MSQRDAFPSFFDQKRKVFFSSPRFPHNDHYCFPNGAGLREEAREKKRDRTDKKIPGTSPLQLSAHGGLLFPIFWLSGNIFLFQNFYYIYIYFFSAGLDEAQARIKIARRNINNLRYGNDTTLMAESKELKGFSS